MGKKLTLVVLFASLSMCVVCRKRGYVVHIENDNNDYALTILKSYASTVSHLGRNRFYHVELSQNNSEVRNVISSLKGVTLYENVEKDISLRRILPDPLGRQMWYWRSSGAMKINEVHLSKGYTGKDVTICVIDDGVDYTIGELAENYRADLSYDYVNNDADPHPRYSQKHGTRVASVAVGGKFNGYCGHGAAPDAKFCAVRAISMSGRISTAREVQSLIGTKEEGGVSRDKETDIFVSSWGGVDDGTSLDKPDTMTLQAMQLASVEGRHGKGSLIVFAAGNGGSMDDCAADGYVSNLYSSAIQSVTENGSIPTYSEHCAATLTSAYVGDGLVAANPQWGGFNPDSCTTSFTGTSAAAPVIAGAAALAIEANPQLSRRDLLHLMVSASTSDGLEQDANWTTNAAGHRFSPYFGFGILNVLELVEQAENQPARHFGEPFSCKYSNSELQSDRASRKFDASQCTDVAKVEYILIRESIIIRRRRNLQIFVTSPSGSRVQMLKRRPDDDGENLLDWEFITPAFWGESPVGEWLVEVDAGGFGIFNMKANLELYGEPHEYPTTSSTTTTATVEEEGWFDRLKNFVCEKTFFC